MANDLLKEAIADAKAVRETALANAKIALEEAFTPRLQSMLSAKLAEEEGEMDMEDPVETDPNGMDAAAGAPVGEGEHDDEPAMEGMHDDEKNEGMHDDEKNEAAFYEGEHEDMENEDLELEAIIKELESEIHEEEDMEPQNEVSDSTDIGKGDNKMDQVSSADQDDPGKGKLKEGEGDDDEKNEGKDDKKDLETEDISIDEIINALREEDEKEEAKNEGKEDDEPVKEYTAGVDDGDAAKLAEAYDVIRFLKGKINEVNLLNAKLLFSNKLFKNHSMNESQKMKVIENFDRASSIREVKLVFATLSESLELSGRKTKRSIKESYASTPSRSTKPAKKVISEGTDLTARWKKLANL